MHHPSWRHILHGDSAAFISDHDTTLITGCMPVSTGSTERCFCQHSPDFEQVRHIYITSGFMRWDPTRDSMTCTRFTLADHDTNAPRRSGHTSWDQRSTPKLRVLGTGFVRNGTHVSRTLQSVGKRSACDCANNAAAVMLDDVSMLAMVWYRLTSVT